MYCLVRLRNLNRPAAVLLICGAAALFSYSCRKEAPPKNFLLITLDTQRADHIGAYPDSKAKTPAVDSLAKRGILFENAWSLIPITLPSHASIFHSRPPHALKNYNNGQPFKIPADGPSSLAGLFKKEGFATGAFVSLGVLGSDFGLADGFDVYEDGFPPGRWYLTAEEVNRKVFPWLERNKDDRFFLWIHYSDPHDPYAVPQTPNDLRVRLNGKPVGEYCLSKYMTQTLTLDLEKGKNYIHLEVLTPSVDDPEQFQARMDRVDFSPEADETEVSIDFPWGWYIRRAENVYFFKNMGEIEIDCKKKPLEMTFTFRGKLLHSVEKTRAKYREEVEYMDGHVGELWNKLDELRLFDKTAILIAGDHGEGLGERQNAFGDPHVGHIHFLHNIYMKVPLVLYRPGARQPGTKRTVPVTLLDVAPTAADIMGLPRLSSFQGKSLLSLGDRKDFTVFEETYKPEAYRDRFALIRGPWHLLFSPEEDAFELYDWESDPGEGNNLIDQAPLPAGALELKMKLTDFARRALKEKVEIRIDSRTEEMLKALGYIKGK